MPSPIGHALGGLAAGWIAGGVSGSPDGGRPLVRALTFVSLGVAPDIDLLFGAHSGPTHGIGAAVVVGMLAAAAVGQPGRLRFALACAAAYASHILLDWLGTDTSAPIGIMALWPVSGRYFEAGWHVFPAVSRRYWRPDAFWTQNLRALITELVLLVPFVLVVWRMRRPPRSTSS